jgi:acetyl esterase/lipase
MVAGVLIGAALVGGAVAVAADSQTLNVVFDNIKLVVNGGEVTPKDANGKAVDPFISDGTTYLPVRAISEALGEPVSWDSGAKTVYIGANPNGEELDYTAEPSDLRPASELAPKAPLLAMPADFPHSAEMPDGVKSVHLNDRGAMPVKVYPDVVYDNKDGEELVLQIITPVDSMAAFTGNVPQFPLSVYVPGSAWMRQDVYASMAQTIRIAEHGYVVAVVEYRGSDVAKFPAMIEDAKTAVRFMRKNAEAYSVNSEKVALWGDSSGAHTSVMAAFTGAGTFDNGTYGDYSCEVGAVVDWYGPTDVSLMAYYDSMVDHTLPNSFEGMFLGGADGVNVLENVELAQKANPMSYISADKDIPPILIMHGSRDFLVPFNQSVRLYEKLIAEGKTVEMYKVEDGSHGSGGFAGDGAIDLSIEFIERQLAK